MQTKMKPVLKEHRRTVRELTLLPLCILCNNNNREGIPFCSLLVSLVLLGKFEKGELVFSGFLTVKAMIEQEVKNGIPSHRIILGGFSQVRLMIVDF